MENEDMRDRLWLVTNKQGYEIEQQQYLPHLHLDQMISTAESHEDLVEAKRLILSHLFTLRKENRHLLRRLDGGTGNSAKYTESRKSQLTNL